MDLRMNQTDCSTAYCRFIFCQQLLKFHKFSQFTYRKCFPVLFLSFSIYCGYGNVKGLKRLFLVGALAAGACGDFLISVCRDMELSFALCAILFGIGHCLYMVSCYCYSKQVKFSPIFYV